MYYQLLNKLDEKFNFSTVSAQCDIPFKSDKPINGKQNSHLKMNHVPITPQVNSNMPSTQ